MKYRVVWAAWLYCFYGITAAAAGLSGTVVDVTGQGLPGAQLELRPISDSGPHLTVKTDKAGEYVFESVPDDTYYVEASLPGFLHCRYHPVSIRGSEPAELSFTLPFDWTAVIKLEVSQPQPD